MRATHSGRRSLELPFQRPVRCHCRYKTKQFGIPHGYEKSKGGSVRPIRMTRDISRRNSHEGKSQV